MKNPEQFEDDAAIAKKICEDMGYPNIFVVKTGAGHKTNEYPGYFGLVLCGNFPTNHSKPDQAERRRVKKAVQSVLGKNRNIRIQSVYEDENGQLLKGGSADEKKT